ncbi:restriction endonuclease subunit S [Salmonella enterica subsp. enterica serovar Emek]|uniref:restriction endonuclease subunit S n=1 Tax=Gammaproteobacteria TaxID=1236 RepID=UPI000F9A0B46|nr:MULTISPECIES: restriction endonuclease subunit S [Gammaproteobacteria]EBV0095601.1 restriction endonuclease subunit S [Salmonella enterica subsp. enterica serovar Emek]ECD2355172.1 restriction endonuclease subunit S [Salmonella enterica subsp. enterica serovar Braenderup]EBW4623243.1 restriction endonuclease subunit S [Salmonella enterica subsp. enterica serovar Emek]EBW5238889.1 restriction endonuclease subunit S [Salmonella enterica subsp. enterica serovar Emek]EDW9078965.1 restriction en
MNAGNIVDAFVSDSKWNLVPAKRLFTSSKEINQGMKESNRLALTMKGVINRSLDDLQGLQSSDYSVYQIFEKDDLVFKLIDLENIKTSRVGIVHERGIMSPAYIRVSACSNSIYPRFYYWYFFALYLTNIYNKLGGGVRQNLTAGDLLEIPVPLIDISLQKQVSAFLDRETQRIDSLIEEKQTFIKLLKEKRQALISHVVTKGLNPTVEMQDSGIEWIGQVPKHWRISKVRYLGQCQNGINIGGEFFGHGTPFVSYGDVYNNTSLPEKVQGLVLSTEKDQDNYSVMAGDVLFTRTSETIEEIGFSAVCKSTIEQAVFAGFLIRFRPDEGNIEVGFSEYYFRNEKLRAFFAKEMNLVTRASLSQDLLKKMLVLLPPIDEQNEIANYLQAECNKFAEIFAETEKTILLLKERRTSLISAAVTGKIDVREAV